MPEIKLEIFDAIIIGVGQSGSPLALALAEKDYKVALIEKNKVGGSCINYGCTPSKTMMASAAVAETVRQAVHFGVEAEIKNINFLKIIKRKNDIVNQFRKGLEKSLKEEDFVELIYGTATFVDKYTIQVKAEEGQDRKLKAEKIFINTGAMPDIPEINGLESVSYLTSTTIMELTEIPDHLLIIGGSYIGLEFGQMFKRFGSKVTIIEHGSQLVGKEDKDVAGELIGILEEEGIDIILKAAVEKAEKNDGKVVLEVAVGKKQQNITGSHLLIATGVKPNTEALNLKAAGIKVNKKKYIEVDDHLETNVENIYAMGDVKGGPAFTHISYD
nr:FAD-dependent oxidoreductase [Bacteroidota bacterium]